LSYNDRDTGVGATPDEKIVEEAKERFQRCVDWEGSFRDLYNIDRKFANADSDNGWQWPDDLRRDREINRRPALTINKVGPLCALIMNDMRQNMPDVSYKPTGGEATFEAAQAIEGVYRHQAYKSNFASLLGDAGESAVEGGIGWVRVLTDYEDDESFQQEITFGPVRDHLSVYLDPDIKMADGSDAKFGFVFDEIPEKEFNRQFPDIPTAANTGLGEADDWVRDGNIRVAEYYRILEKPDELIYLVDRNGKDAKFRRSELTPELKAQLEAAVERGDDFKSRKIKKYQLEWYKIAGSKVVDKRKLKGRYIPLVRVIGKERVIEGKLERKGHVRPLKDAQRMYNVNSSSQVEAAYLNTKTPWLVATDAVAGNEVAWNNLNRNNPPYLTFKHKDEDGDPIPPPQRIDSSVTSNAWMDGMKIAASELEMISGQTAPQQANPLLERTPQAINAREKKGDVVNGHFQENLAMAVRHAGRIFLDLFPHYYDTERVVKILGKDGTQNDLRIKPDAESAYEEQRDQKDADEVRSVLNPNIGKYAVQSDSGPSYATQRQEQWDAFVQIASKNGDFMNEFGDLMFQAADFPNADKISERFLRKIKQMMPWLLDDNATNPAVSELQQQLKEANGALAEAVEKIAELRISLKGKDEKRDIDAFGAETDRMKVIIEAAFEHVLAKQKAEHEIESQAHQHIFNVIEDTNAATLQSMALEEDA
jgi:hypothetical protein